MSSVIEPGEILIPLHHVAKALGWRSERLARRFAAAHLAYQITAHGEWLVASSTVARLFPGVLLRIDEMRARGELKTPGRARVGNRSARKKAAA